MLPFELRDSSLVGIIRTGADSRTRVTSLGSYVSVEHQSLVPASRMGPAHWYTMGGGDFFDPQQNHIEALREALAKRNEEKNKLEQSNLS